MVSGWISILSTVADWCRFHTLMYTSEGKTTTNRLWDETLQELSFAGVEGVLQSMK